MTRILYRFALCVIFVILIAGCQPKSVKVSSYEKQTSPPGEKLNFAAEVISSPRSDLPHGIRVIVQTTVTIKPVHIIVTFSGPVGYANVSFPGTVSIMESMATSRKNNTYEFSFANPPFTPQKPLIIDCFSKEKVRALNVVHIQ